MLQTCKTSKCEILLNSPLKMAEKLKKEIIKCTYDANHPLTHTQQFIKKDTKQQFNRKKLLTHLTIPFASILQASQRLKLTRDYYFLNFAFSQTSDSGDKQMGSKKKHSKHNC